MAALSISGEGQGVWSEGRDAPRFAYCAQIEGGRGHMAWTVTAWL